MKTFTNHVGLQFRHPSEGAISSLQLINEEMESVAMLNMQAGKITRKVTSPSVPEHEVRLFEAWAVLEHKRFSESNERGF